MSSSSSQPGGYLVDWRNSFSLVRNNTYCKNGQTFRGKNSRVEMPFSLNQTCINLARNDAGRSSGTAKPGPTVDNSSRIARIKKLQTRTRSTNVAAQSNGGTQRGAHPSVQNGTSGVNVRSARAQLFGSQGTIPSQTSGIGGSSSDVIYFKRVFDRVSLNDPTPRSGSQVVDNN